MQHSAVQYSPLAHLSLLSSPVFSRLVSSPFSLLLSSPFFPHVSSNLFSLPLSPLSSALRLFNEETYQSCRNHLGKYGLEGHAHCIPIRSALSFPYPILSFSVPSYPLPIPSYPILSHLILPLSHLYTIPSAPYPIPSYPIQFFPYPVLPLFYSILFYSSQFYAVPPPLPFLSSLLTLPPHRLPVQMQRFIRRSEGACGIRGAVPHGAPPPLLRCT